MGLSLPCGGSLGCDVVAAHPSSHFLGIPVAAYGVAAYLTIWLGLSRGLVGGLDSRSRAFLATYLICIAGLIISLSLLAFSALQLKAVCSWCVASTILISLTCACCAGIRSFEGQLRGGQSPLALLCFAGALSLGSFAYFDRMTYSASRVTFDRNALARMPLSELAPERSMKIGASSARYKLLVFADIQCSTCREMVPGLLRYARTHADTQLVIRHFPQATHPGSFEMAALYERLAKKQGAEKATDAVFSVGYSYDPRQFAELIGFAGSGSASAAVATKEEAETIWADVAAARRLGLQQTPVAIWIEGSEKSVLSYKALSRLAGNT